MAQLDQKSTSEHLATYLNDHLAGATAAVAMLNTLKTHSEVASIADLLLRDVEADKHELEGLMESLGIDRSHARQTVARISGKLVEMKASMDDSARGTLARFELLEALSLGIEGKRALWQALQASASAIAPLQGINYDRLIARAEDQRRTAETLRLQLAIDAFRAA
jgi:hypothetical protein